MGHKSHHIAETYQAVGNYQEAQAWLDKVFALIPLDPGLYAQKAYYYSDEGKFDAAREVLESAPPFRNPARKAEPWIEAVYLPTRDFQSAYREIAQVDIASQDTSDQRMLIRLRAGLNFITG